MTLWGRLLLAAVLLGVLVGTGVHYDVTEEHRWPYPTSDELAADYDPHVDSAALVFGTVQSVTDDTDAATITVEYDQGTFPMRVQRFDARVDPGGVVQVYGVLRPDRTIDAQSIVVVNPSGGSTAYKYAVSVVGALLILVLFFSRWRVDRDERGFVPRGDDGG